MVVDLNCVTTVVPLRQRGDLSQWKPGAAWLAGGTWLFSEPQPSVDTLLDMAPLSWPPIIAGTDGVSIAATCTFAQLFAYSPSPDHVALNLIEPCCRALLGSFKIWNMATVGGNICLALPAAPMIAFAVALDGEGLIWTKTGDERRVSILDLVTGPTMTSLAPGEVLRAIDLPAAALRRRTAHRRVSLTAGGRSAAFLIGTRDRDTMSLTVTASTRRPVRLDLAKMPSSEDLGAAIDDAIPFAVYHDDVHGLPSWRRHLTYLLAEEIRRELMDF